MTTQPNPAIHRYCWSDPTCIRACVHSGDHVPGCRRCHKEDHLSEDCPTWADDGTFIAPDPEPVTDAQATLRRICGTICDCRETGKQCVLKPEGN